MRISIPLAFLFAFLEYLCYRNGIKNEAKNMKFNHKEQVFPVILEQDETGGYVVTNPAFEGCYSQGDTVEKALENIREATELCLMDLEDENKTAKTKEISLHLITLKNNYA